MYPLHITPLPPYLIKSLLGGEQAETAKASTSAAPQRIGRKRKTKQLAAPPLHRDGAQPPTWLLLDNQYQNLKKEKTSIRLVIAARLADVLAGIALDFSAEFGRNTPTGAS